MLIANNSFIKQRLFVKQVGPSPNPYSHETVIVLELESPLGDWWAQMWTNNSYLKYLIYNN